MSLVEWLPYQKKNVQTCKDRYTIANRKNVYKKKYLYLYRTNTAFVPNLKKQFGIDIEKIVLYSNNRQDIQFYNNVVRVKCSTLYT